MLLLIPLAFCIAFLFVRSGKFNTTLAGLGTLTILWGIILTQSRGGLLGILAILALAGSRVIKNKVVLCSIGAVAAVALYGAMALSDRISGGDQDVQGLSAQNRIYAWGAGIRMAAARPLTGVGLGNFANQSQNFSSALDREYTAHSVWFLVLGETGLPGFVAFMVMVVAGLLTSIRNNARVSQACSVPLLKAVSLSLTGALIGFLVTGCFGSYAYHWPLYVLLAFIVALDRYLAASNQLNAFISRSSAEVGDPAGLPRSDV
jgi:O-antigen ligase